MKAGSAQKIFQVANTALNYCLFFLVALCAIAIVRLIFNPDVPSPVRTGGGGIPVIDMQAIKPICTANGLGYELDGDLNKKLATAGFELERICKAAEQSAPRTGKDNG